MRGVGRQSLSDARAHLGRLVGSADDATVERVASELLMVVHLLDDQLRLRRAVTDPGLPPDQRAGLLSALLAGKVSDQTAEVLDLVTRSSWSTARDAVDAIDDLATQALFILAERQGSLDDLEDELFRFGRIVDREPALRAALTDPALPAERTTALLDALVAPRVLPATAALVRELVLHPRGRTLDRGLEEYARLAAARRDRLVARVRTVVPLTDEQLQRLAGALERQLGHPVHVNVEIDRDLVGGIAVRVGDELFDGSIAHRIAEARRHVAGG
ncbi:MAG: F0F1 ATP synthase subunit delta [Frankiaceae bacterium]